MIESELTASPYDHLRQKQYLYVRVVAGKDLIERDAARSYVEAADRVVMEGTDLVEKDAARSYVESDDQVLVPGTDLVEKEDVHRCDPYVEVQVRLGDNKGTTTRYFKNNENPEWNQVFAISREKIKADMLEVAVKAGKEDEMKDDFMGWVLYDLCIAPKRVPPDSPVAPQWYRLEDRKGVKLKGELMLAVWWGTKADEAFSDSIGVSDVLASMGSKVYDSPTLWYVTVHLIEVQDLIPSDTTRLPEVFVKATLGNQYLRTRISNSINPHWNEELRFVAAEPFKDHLVLSVEDRVAPGKNEVLGRCVIPLHYVDRRLDDRAISSRWFNLEREVIIEGEKRKEVKFDSRIHMRICLEGGYHVLDESADYISDLRPTAKQLWKNSIGVLELGILSAHGLLPMKTRNGRETTDAYCVAKYGKKWVRTRTISDTSTPKWNEQYTWEVFDQCTVITIGVFDNCHLQGGGARDSRIGKVRIRLSTLETDRVYTHSYPLLVLHPSGVKKLGEIHLAVRFTCSSLLNMMHMYSQPLLPKMHYIHPLTVTQLDHLRHQATQIVSMRLSRAEPPLRKEIVEYMLDVGSHMWSMRRSKANFFRIMGVLGITFEVKKSFDDQIYDWNHPIYAVVFYILFFMLVLYPALILPSVFLYLFLIGIWNYRWRPRSPPGMNTRLSHAESVHPDEVEEEFDTFPTSCTGDMIILWRYDRLRTVCGRLQTLAGDIATQGEKFQSLLSWRDPRATALFVIFCLIAAIVLYTIPFYVIIIQTVLSGLNHPWFNKKLPSVPINFFRRLPANTDRML